VFANKDIYKGDKIFVVPENLMIIFSDITEKSEIGKQFIDKRMYS
jgi:hypothetical protein